MKYALLIYSAEDVGPQTEAEMAEEMPQWFAFTEELNQAGANLAGEALLPSSMATTVRVRDGEVSRTEFSSSTGGWTAGGLFPAVEDLGDAVSLNPNHDWEDSISIAAIEARYSNRTLDRIYVSERNGLGEDGGRVLAVTLEFGDETFEMDGNEFRRFAGLKSDWFSIEWRRVSDLAPCVCDDEPQ